MNSSIVLASRSPRRIELLRQIGIDPRVIPADIDERRRPGESPEAYVIRMAREKSAAVQVDDDTLVIGADTAVVLGDRVFGKPESAAGAEAMLRELAGRRHRVLSAVAVRRGERTEARLSASEVRFRALSDEEIQRYRATGEPVDKAGGYAIQGLAAMFVESIDGSYSGIMGLPLFETAALLALFGMDPLFRDGSGPRDSLQRPGPGQTDNSR